MQTQGNESPESSNKKRDPQQDKEVAAKSSFTKVIPHNTKPSQLIKRTKREKKNRSKTHQKAVFFDELYSRTHPHFIHRTSSGDITYLLRCTDSHWY